MADSVLDYGVTVSDPKTFTAPWKVEFPITHEPGYQIFEYVMNAMHNRPARAEEKAEAQGK